MRFPRLDLMAVCISALILSAAAQKTTFKVTTKEVRIDVLVTDHKKLVTGLQATDFEILDNGVRQQVEFVRFEQVPISATLVFDISASVAGERLDNLKNAGSKLLNELRKDERAALITFGHAVKLGSPLTTDIVRIKTAIDGIQPYGQTSVIDACYTGLILTESKSERPLLIVFSDDLDTFSWLTHEEVLELAKKTDTVVYAVLVGRLKENTKDRFTAMTIGPSLKTTPDDTFLRDLAKFTGGSLFEVESTKDLSSIFLGILNEFRGRYLLTYIPQNVSNSGWHTLKVRVKNRGSKIMHRPGYMTELIGTEKK